MAGGAAALVGNGAALLWWATSSFSCGVSLVGSELLLFVATLAVAGLLLAALLAAFRKARGVAAALFAACLVYVVTFALAAWAGGAIRMHGFKLFAERSRPLVRAIEAYSQAHGRPPGSLQDLVPAFLPAIPPTGVGSSPEYIYRVGESLPEGNPWVLELDVGIGVLNWDTLIFYPLQNYPPGAYERIAEWAYVHE